MADKELKNLTGDRGRVQRTQQQTIETAQHAPNLESTLGNQTMQGLLTGKPTNAGVGTFIQAKMSVNDPNDAYEKEADSVATSVVSSIQTKPVQREAEEELQAKRIQRVDEEELQAKRIQREAEEEEIQAKRIQREGAEEEEIQAKRIQREGAEEEEVQAKRIQREGAEEEEIQAKRIQRTSGEDKGFEVGGDIEQQIESSRGGGQGMDDATRGSFEGAMGYDLSGVNIHTGAEASNLSRSVDAKAFTTGSDIYFSEGQYNPSSSDGQFLLGHELTHVVQQGHAKPIQNKEE